MGNFVPDYDPSVDPRKEKRAMRKMGMSDPVYEAYCLGEAAGSKKNPHNPYPPGRRYNEWERGLKLSDPMFDHWGQNE